MITKGKSYKELRDEILNNPDINPILKDAITQYEGYVEEYYLDQLEEATLLVILLTKKCREVGL